ncbi:MAG TPA: urate hydroxylase PuuD [Thermoanaerobaculia bacterium]|nr:urate hydroxylase PuuD [Thermoanaerobaculia bacterium]
MPYPAEELINLALRWVHVVAAIFWIGQTALFTWLDTRLRVEGDENGRQVWMVHGGGFYRVEKLPWQAPPRLLHWFRWEAAVTWGSGFLLLVWVYWLGEILVPPGGAVAPVAAMGLSLAVLLGGTAAYDALWSSPLARRQGLAAAVSFAALVALAWGLTQVFTSRAAFLQVGATLGTIMTANVWSRILPAMREAVAAARAGRELDAGVQARVARAGQRSRHNTFLAFPVVFLMISNHYPVTTYGHRWNWLLLGVFTLLGMAARWLVNRHEARPARSDG